MNSDIDIVKTGITSLVSLLGAWGIYRGTRAGQRDTRELALVNEIQEERSEIRKERDSLRAEFDAFKKEVRAEIELLETKNRRLIAHIWTLTAHINDRKGPPAPPLPEGLL